MSSERPGQGTPHSEDLEPLAAVKVPPIDPMFTARLETELRAEHVARTSRRRTAAPLFRRGLVAVAASIVAVAGVLALGQLRADDTTVPLEIADAPTAAAATGDPADAGSGDAAAAPSVQPAPGDSTPTPDPTPPTPPTVTSVTPVAPLTPGAVLAVPTAVPTITATPTPISASPTATATVAATVTSSPTPTISTPTSPTPTVTPTTTPTTGPTATPIPSPTATATLIPTVVPEAVRITMQCESLTVDAGAAVRCSWPTTTTTSIDRWVVQRIRNGAAREVVATLRPADIEVIDALVRSGDDVTYVIRGWLGDEVVVVAAPVTVIVE